MLRADGLRGLLVPLLLIAGLCFGAAPQPAWAHGDGEDAHADAPTTSGDVAISPRIVARSRDFELVGVTKGKTLDIYLDRSADNQPVLGAKLDVEIDGKAVPVAAEAGGLYTADWVAQPGRHDVVVTIMSDQGSDLLAGSIDVPTEPIGAGPASTVGTLSSSPIDSIIAFLLGMAVSSVLLRRSSLAAILRRAAEPAQAGGRHLVGAMRQRLADLAARLREAASTAWTRLLSGAMLRRLQRLPGSLKAFGEGLGRIVRSRIEAILVGRPAEAGDGEAGIRRPVLIAASPLSSGQSIGRVGASTVAVICLVMIVAIVFLLFGRGVLAGAELDRTTAGKPPPTAAPAASLVGASGPRRLLDGSLFVPKDTQRLLNLRTTIAETSQVARTLRVVGQVIADPGMSGQIHATIRGRLEPVKGSFPKVGQKVEAGEVLAWVVPVINPIDRGIILQQLAQIDREIGLAQERAAQLSAADSEASPRMVDDARSDLANLSRRRQAIAAVVRDRDKLRAPLLAPSSGIIAASFAASGQIVDEQQKLFDVVDLRHLWVEAYAYDVAAVGEVVDATAQGVTGGNYQLKFISRGPQLQKQTIPLYFHIENPDSGLSVGSLVSVMLETKGERLGVVLPHAAVTRSTSGQDIVWQHAHPESFIPVPVRIEPIDGSKVLVTAGVSPNMRVVTESADLLNEVR